MYEQRIQRHAFKSSNIKSFGQRIQRTLFGQVFFFIIAQLHQLTRGIIYHYTVSNTQLSLTHNHAPNTIQNCMQHSATHTKQREHSTFAKISFWQQPMPRAEKKVLQSSNPKSVSLRHIYQRCISSNFNADPTFVGSIQRNWNQNICYNNAHRGTLK